MRISAAAITLLALLAGCGQMGPLYHPGDEPIKGQQPEADEPAVDGTSIDDNSATEAP